MSTTASPSRYIIRNGLRLVTPYNKSREFKVTRKVTEQLKNLHDTQTLKPTPTTILTRILGVDEKALESMVEKRHIGVINKGLKRPLYGEKLLSDRFILKPGSTIRHIQHFHEPVLRFDGALSNTSATELKSRLVFQNDDMFVLDKPAGMPCVPFKKVYYNSATMILMHELGMLDKFKDDQLKQKNYIQKHGLVAVKPLMAIPSGLCVITKGKPLSEKFDIEKSTFLTKTH
ncbi:unnamed protein product [Ambrosiozyma monospora]|uniref:Unnamed protein product n=1 Tax=Ambrosiozyma monospora TaxID=43982 RepID=A0A9W6Z1A0_AMBMO|nr:unnamed protein product [Ambrosiozyma monospora]